MTAYDTWEFDGEAVYLRRADVSLEITPKRGVFNSDRIAAAMREAHGDVEKAIRLLRGAVMVSANERGGEDALNVVRA